MHNLKTYKLIRWLVAVLFVVASGTWIYGNFDPRVFLTILRSADTLKICFYFPLLILAVWLVRTLRWALVLRSAGTMISPIRLYLSIGTSLGLAAVTPVQSGEMLKVKHAVDDGDIGILRAIGGFAAERFYDVFVLLTLTTLATLVELKSLAQSFAVFALIAIGLLALAAFALNAAPAARLPGWVVDLLETFRVSTRRPTVAFGLAALTTICWVLTALMWQVGMSAIGVNVTLVASTGIVGIVSFASLASMVPGGVGVAEATISGLLILLGFAPEQALSAALVLRLISFWIVALGLIHWVLLESFEPCRNWRNLRRLRGSSPSRSSSGSAT